MSRTPLQSLHALGHEAGHGNGPVWAPFEEKIRRKIKNIAQMKKYRKPSQEVFNLKLLPSHLGGFHWQLDLKAETVIKQTTTLKQAGYHSNNPNFLKVVVAQPIGYGIRDFC